MRNTLLLLIFLTGCTTDARPGLPTRPPSATGPVRPSVNTAPLADMQPLRPGRSLALLTDELRSTSVSEQLDAWREIDDRRHTFTPEERRALLEACKTPFPRVDQNALERLDPLEDWPYENGHIVRRQTASLLMYVAVRKDDEELVPILRDLHAQIGDDDRTALLRSLARIDTPDAYRTFGELVAQRNDIFMPSWYDVTEGGHAAEMLPALRGMHRLEGHALQYMDALCRAGRATRADCDRVRSHAQADEATNRRAPATRRKQSPFRPGGAFRKTR